MQTFSNAQSSINQPESRKQAITIAPVHAPALPQYAEYVVDSPATSTSLPDYEDYVFFDPVRSSPELGMLPLTVAGSLSLPRRGPRRLRPLSPALPLRLRGLLRRAVGMFAHTPHLRHLYLHRRQQPPHHRLGSARPEARVRVAQKTMRLL